MYSKIVNPQNGKLENLGSLFGKQILNNYVTVLNKSRTVNVMLQQGGVAPQGALVSWGVAPEEVVAAAQLQAPDIIGSITGDIILDPVLTRDGFTYERSSIEKWFRTRRERGLPPTSPLTGAVLDNADLIPNIALKQRIAKWIEDNGYTTYWNTRQGELGCIDCDVSTADGARGAIIRMAAIVDHGVIYEELSSRREERERLEGIWAEAHLPEVLPDGPPMLHRQFANVGDDPDSIAERELLVATEEDRIEVLVSRARRAQYILAGTIGVDGGVIGRGRMARPAHGGPWLGPDGFPQPPTPPPRDRR